MTLEQHDVLPTIEAALSGLTTALAADGYRLVIDTIDPEVQLRIDTVGDVCGDCLVPESVLVPMVAQALEGTEASQRVIKVRYPNE